MIPNPDFKVAPLFNAEYLGNGTRQKDSYNGILTGTYMCHSLFEGVISNDLK